MGLKDKQGKREWRMKKGELENKKEKKKWEIEVDMWEREEGSEKAHMREE